MGSSEQTFNTHLNIDDEINKYLHLCQSFDPQNDDAMDFWKRNKAFMPLLFNLMSAIYAIPISSADAERSFSVAGSLLRAKRAKLNPHRAHKVLFIHDNIHLLEEKDLNAIEKPRPTEN